MAVGYGMGCKGCVIWFGIIIACVVIVSAVSVVIIANVVIIVMILMITWIFVSGWTLSTTVITPIKDIIITLLTTIYSLYFIPLNLFN